MIITTCDICGNSFRLRFGNESCPHCMLQADLQRILPETLVAIDAMLQQNRRQEARKIAQAALKISPRRATFLLNARDIPFQS